MSVLIGSNARARVDNTSTARRAQGPRAPSRAPANELAVDPGGRDSLVVHGAVCTTDESRSSTRIIGLAASSVSMGDGHGSATCGQLPRSGALFSAIAPARHALGPANRAVTRGTLRLRGHPAGLVPNAPACARHLRFASKSVHRSRCGGWDAVPALSCIPTLSSAFLRRLMAFLCGQRLVALEHQAGSRFANDRDGLHSR